MCVCVFFLWAEKCVLIKPTFGSSACFFRAFGACLPVYYSIYVCVHIAGRHALSLYCSCKLHIVPLLPLLLLQALSMYRYSHSGFGQIYG